MEFDHCINYLLTVAQHEVFQNFSSRLAPYNITPGQYGVMNCIWQSEGGTVTPKEIARTLRLETPTVSGVLDRMQKQGLIDRVLDPNDRRSIQVQATPAGMAIKDDVLQVIEELNVEVLKPLTASEKETLLACLRKVGHTGEDG